jgi:hypothetical protein
VDLAEKAWQAKIAKFIVGTSNRQTRIWEELIVIPDGAEEGPDDLVALPRERGWRESGRTDPDTDLTPWKDIPAQPGQMDCR